MPAQTADELRSGSCQPCEGGVPKLSADEAREQTAMLDGWELDGAAAMISKKSKFKDFKTAMAFLHHVAMIAETQQHHPDLHLTGYNRVRIDLTTHAIDGLSQNDFIMAAKIDGLPPV